MKILTIIISIVALGLIGFNLTKVDFSDPFQGESTVALITIVAALCSILIMLILNTSKRIESKVNKGK
ncbi:hypothetical protein [Gaetbulibacter saemankumensis]|uniref:hypothetical protein n=1 Tax=Gaetbulibacter saemankumensis TaxID=311208 RepID=UPI0003FE4459|nr:hypothetical protein [Gaetbulibacter saemankumensis]